MTFVVLDSGTTAAAAMARIDAAGEIDVVLVRRLTIDGTIWHAVDPTEMAERLIAASDEARISSLVTLDGLNRVPQSDITAVEAEGVVVDGDRVVGFSFPETAAPRAPTRGAAPPVVEPPPRLDELHEAALPPRPGSREEAGSAPSSFAAHADIEAPTTVARDEEFLVALGLTADPAAPTLGSGIWIEDLDPGAAMIAIDVHLVGDFEVVDAGGAARTFDVDRTTLAHAPVAFKVRPGAPPPSFDPADGVWIGRLMMLFSHRGVPCGQSWREVRVNMSGSRGITRESDRTPPASSATTIGPRPVPPPDLTVSLTRTPSAAQDGIFSLVLQSPHFSDPVETDVVELGNEPQAFSSQLIAQVAQHINDRVSDELLNGIAKEIADKLPAPFWMALRTVWDAVRAKDPDSVPTVLLLSDDPYVPWELAWLDEPLDEAAPCFLGAQVNIGRWSADPATLPLGDPLDVKGLGVVIGNYEDARGVAPLPSATEEGAALTAAYNARAVNATDIFLDQILRGRLEDEGFDFEAVHFAGHGESDPEKNAAYVMLSNGSLLSDFVFREAAIASQKQAFLFLNACQVGTAFSMLGEYAGVAGRAIRAGFRGFVAPLWSVADDVAKEISIGFYEASATGKSASEYFRSIRSRFRETDTSDAHTTWLAYLFYGHPAVRLNGPKKRESS